MTRSELYLYKGKYDFILLYSSYKQFYLNTIFIW